MAEVESATLCMPSRCSTTELHPRIWWSDRANAPESPACRASVLLLYYHPVLVEINTCMYSTPPTKICSACKVEKDRSDFYTRSQNGKKYPEARCKQCSTKRTTDRLNSDENYRVRHKEWAQESARKHQAKRKADRLSKDPEVLAAILFEDYRTNDRKKNRDNDLTMEFICEAIKQPCSYCDDTECKMTLDRCDNSVGHLQANVVPCCYRCNISRGNMPYNAWMEIAPAMKSARIKGLFGDWMSKPFSRK